MNSGGLRLGLDLGTSAVKAVALDPSGRVVARGQAAFPTRSELPGQAEQEPRAWLDACAEAVAAIGEALGSGWSDRVAAIGLAGQLPTLVCMGAEGPAGPAITWADGRADRWASTVLDAERRDQLYRRTGMPIDGRYLAPMFRFHWHDKRARVARILSAKDFLCHALTGRFVTDPATAAGYGVYALAERRWDEALCAAWDLDAALLPEILPAAAVAGGLHEAGAALLGLPQGVPVAVGTADSVAGALALSGVQEGVVTLSFGSSAIVMDATPALLLDPRRRYLVTPHALEHWFGREMDVLSAGSGFQWLATLLASTPEDLAARAMQAPAGANGLLFAPYLAGGEQGALWDPELRGALHGLTTRHTGADIARAFLEGILFEVRRCIEVLAETKPVERVVAAGHLVAGRAAVALAADILDRPVQRCGELSPAAVGAALLAAPDASKTAGCAVAVDAPVAPGPAAAAYDRLYRQYTAVFPRAAQPAASNDT